MVLDPSWGEFLLVAEPIRQSVDARCGNGHGLRVGAEQGLQPADDLGNLRKTDHLSPKVGPCLETAPQSR